MSLPLCLLSTAMSPIAPMPLLLCMFPTAMSPIATMPLPLCMFPTVTSLHFSHVSPCVHAVLPPRYFIAPVPLTLLPNTTSLHCSHVSPFVPASYYYVPSLLPCLSLCPCFLPPRPFVAPTSFPLTCFRLPRPSITPTYLLICLFPITSSHNCSHVSPFVPVSDCHVPPLLPRISYFACFLSPRPFVAPMSLPVCLVPTATSLNCSHVSPMCMLPTATSLYCSHISPCPCFPV